MWGETFKLTPILSIMFFEKKHRFNSLKIENLSTVKPVYKDHPWDQEKVVVIRRVSLPNILIKHFKRAIIQKCSVY